MSKPSRKMTDCQMNKHRVSSRVRRREASGTIDKIRDLLLEKGINPIRVETKQTVLNEVIFYLKNQHVHFFSYCICSDFYFSTSPLHHSLKKSWILLLKMLSRSIPFNLKKKKKKHISSLTNGTTS